MKNFKNATILIVDDNVTNVKVLHNFLQAKGFQIAVALNGEDALEILKAEQIDLVLLDIMMPGMNGFEVCKIMKKNPDLATIPVLFLSAKSDTEDVVYGFEVGGVDYITKPFRKEELLVRVNTHLKIKLVQDFLQTVNTAASAFNQDELLYAFQQAV